MQGLDPYTFVSDVQLGLHVGSLTYGAGALFLILLPATGASSSRWTSGFGLSGREDAESCWDLMSLVRGVLKGSSSSLRGRGGGSGSGGRDL